MGLWSGCHRRLWQTAQGAWTSHIFIHCGSPSSPLPVLCLGPLPICGRSVCLVQNDDLIKDLVFENSLAWVGDGTWPTIPPLLEVKAGKWQLQAWPGWFNGLVRLCFKTNKIRARGCSSVLRPWVQCQHWRETKTKPKTRQASQWEENCADWYHIHAGMCTHKHLWS